MWLPTKLQPHLKPRQGGQPQSKAMPSSLSWLSIHTCPCNRRLWCVCRDTQRCKMPFHLCINEKTAKSFSKGRKKKKKKKRKRFQVHENLEWMPTKLLKFHIQSHVISFQPHESTGQEHHLITSWSIISQFNHRSQWFSFTWWWFESNNRRTVIQDSDFSTPITNYYDVFQKVELISQP